MSLGLGRLKGLAMNLNEELEEHNAILDRLDDKTANADWRVKKQNKDMDKILNPKKKQTKILRYELMQYYIFYRILNTDK